MSESSQSKVVVLLTDDEHKLLKAIAAQSRRTLGQELAYRAFQAIAAIRADARRAKKARAA